MVNMTLAVSEDLHQRLNSHPELKWSEIARQAFEKKLQEVELEHRILAKSKLTETDAEALGHKIKAEMRKRFV